MERKLMLFVLILGIFTFFAELETEGREIPVNCPSEAVCESIAPDNQHGILTECEDSESRNDKSRTICTVVYVDDPDENVSENMRNPNPRRCQVTNSESARGACAIYVRTHSLVREPFNGITLTYCYSEFRAYFCKLGQNTYVTCSIQAVPSPSVYSCGSSLPNGNNTLLTGKRKYLNSPL